MRLNFYSWSIMFAYRGYRRALHSRSMYSCKRAIENLNCVYGQVLSTNVLTIDEKKKYFEYIQALNDKAFDLFIELANSNE